MYGAVALALIVGFLGLSNPKAVIDATKVDVNAIANAVLAKVQGTFGASAGPLHTEKQEFVGGVIYGNNIATSSSGNVTMLAGDFRSWVDADVVILSTAGAEGARTITFPASSTVSAALPNVGDMSKTCVYNATTSATTIITFAGGTGITLEVASSTASVMGSTRLSSREVGCFTFIRQDSTTSSFDISALYTAFDN